MKILHFFPYLPTPATFGGALRVYHILKHLSENYEVTVAGYCEYGDMDLFKKEFPSLVDKSHFIKRKFRRGVGRRLIQVASYLSSHSYWYNWSYSKELENNLNNLLAEQDFDVVMGEFASMGHFNLHTDAIRVIDAHNVEYDNFRRMSTLEFSWIRKNFYKREYERSYKEEIAAFKKQDALLVTSARDGSIIKKDVPEVPQFVIPNGVDTSYFSSGGVDPEPFSLVFTGTMGYVPNYDGMLYFLKQIFPIIKRSIPEAKIYIVGSNPPPTLLKHQSNSVIITGFVDDVRPYIDKASVFVVPLRMGSGTRLKVVEALSMQKPVVSTSIGSEGIDVTDNEDLLLRDEPEAFAEAVIELFSNGKLRSRLIDSGYNLVKSKYDWNVIGQSMDRAFLELMSKKPQVMTR